MVRGKSSVRTKPSSKTARPEMAGPDGSPRTSMSALRRPPTSIPGTKGDRTARSMSERTRPSIAGRPGKGPAVPEALIDPAVPVRLRASSRKVPSAKRKRMGPGFERAAPPALTRRREISPSTLKLAVAAGSPDARTRPATEAVSAGGRPGPEVSSAESRARSRPEKVTAAEKPAGTASG